MANWQTQRLQGVIVELLKFQDAPDLRENFIQKDTQIWTTGLAEYLGISRQKGWQQPQPHISYANSSLLTTELIPFLCEGTLNPFNFFLCILL
ncbi:MULTISPECIES: hypothetical protein [unclassified Nostoc]|uniref:hypothetical protein n=1 Tax=unclassified Nostoc TaxID=2593658 RepID=UPI00118111A2|nr:hypothetical protein [Nostoc sp. 'Peltigera membranacea cyanobiont' 213]